MEERAEMQLQSREFHGKVNEYKREEQHLVKQRKLMAVLRNDHAENPCVQNFAHFFQHTLWHPSHTSHTLLHFQKHMPCLLTVMCSSKVLDMHARYTLWIRTPSIWLWYWPLCDPCNCLTDFWLVKNHIISTKPLSQLSLLACIIILFSSTVSATMKLDLREQLCWLIPCKWTRAWKHWSK